MSYSRKVWSGRDESNVITAFPRPACGGRISKRGMLPIAAPARVVVPEGFEPSSLVCKTSVFPLDDGAVAEMGGIRTPSQWINDNHPSAGPVTGELSRDGYAARRQSAALPLSYISMNLVAAEGVEPSPERI